MKYYRKPAETLHRWVLIANTTTETSRYNENTRRSSTIGARALIYLESWLCFAGKLDPNTNTIHLLRACDKPSSGYNIRIRISNGYWIWKPIPFRVFATARSISKNCREYTKRFHRHEVDFSSLKQNNTGSSNLVILHRYLLVSILQCL